jgi:hypothetical protein
MKLTKKQMEAERKKEQEILEKYSHHTYRQLAMIIENLEKEVSGLER